MSICCPDSSFEICLTDSDGEEFLSPPAAAAAGAAAAARPDPSLQQGEHQQAAAGDAMARTRTQRSNATVSTPAGRKAGAAGGRKAAPAPQQQPASAAVREARGRKRAATSAAQAADEEQENRPVQNAAPAGEAAQPQKRQRRGSAAAAATPAAPAAPPAAGGRQRRTRASAGKQQQQAQQAEEQQQHKEEEAAERRQAAAAAAPEPQQQQAAVVQRRQRQQQQPLASQGPQPSQSVRDSIFSPSPKSRARPSDSNAARQSISVSARPTVMPQLRQAAAEAAAAAAAAVEQGAVDQPVAQQAQQAEPAAAAAAVQPEAAAGEPSAAAPQTQQQEGAAEQAAAAFERTGSSPLRPASAKRQRTSPRRSPPQTLAADSGRPSAVRFSLPPVQEGAAAAAGGAEAAAHQWWDPLDPEKVKAVKQALHISSYSKGTLPLCREKQADEVAAWLQRQMAAGRGGTMYLSGPPGTGKSLTAHEVVRQCWRPAPPAGGEPGADAAAQQAQPQAQVPPPALISINCMSLTDPQQVVERILLGYSKACSAPPPEAAEAAGQDPIVYPAAEAASNAAAGSKARRRSASDPLQQLQRLILSPLPGAASTEAEPEPAARGGRGCGGRKSGGRGQKRKSAGGGAAAAAAAGAGERGWLVVILDELDSLLSGSKGEELVEGLFVLAHSQRSRLLLLGIANSIDLVQQLMLPGGTLQRNGLRPQHELFPSYQKTQISRVLHQRLESLPGRVFQPNAIELCCRKMMNGNGDMRLALQACALAAEVAARAAAQAAAEAARGQDGGGGGGKGGESPTSKPSSNLVGMQPMARALNTVCGGPSMHFVQSLKALPPQQQLMMAALGKLLGDLLPNRGLVVRAPAAMPTPASSRKAGGKTAAASRARASFMSPANSASSRKSSSSLSSLLSGGSVNSGMLRSREVLLGQWEEACASLCRQVGVEAYTSREFGTACDNLKEMALIELANAKEPKRCRVIMRASEDDIIMALSDIPVISKAVA